uniref:Uncharacterized protein n=1 Tax=Thermogemmatispora argillosa TaxID=2045280 RepID=A0A455T5X5_9CHLR|nr:hypothetical protein KTA_36190 [Thermogemmatispora argillosa]
MTSEPTKDNQKSDGRLQPRHLRAIRAGSLRVLALGSESESEMLARHFLRQGWSLRRTPHFLAFRRQQAREEERVLIHRLSIEESDNRLVDYLQQELVSIGWLQGEDDFNATLNALIVSFGPTEPLQAWRRFALNTFARLSALIAPAPPGVDPGEKKDSGETITAFAAIYRRLLTLLQGGSLLDVGCACAYWPLLVVKGGHCSPGPIVAVDRRVEALRLSALVAEALGLTDRLHLVQLDLLQPAFLRLGQFDTVTAIHLLEHLDESDLPRALDQLLHVTRRRLLIAVPYEERAQECYGHRQIFSAEKLQFWGQWCCERLEGRASYWCEDLLGGLLVIERLGHPG